MVTIPLRLLTLYLAAFLAVVTLVQPLFATSVLAQADAGPATASPTVTLKRFSDAAVVVLSQPNLSDVQRRTEFRRLIATGFDLDRISRFVLGRFWRRASADQRREYRRLFEDFIVATYARRLDGYSGESLQIGRVRDLGGVDIVVSSRVIRPREEPLQIDWRMVPFSEDWRIVDVMVEGISMAVTQRQEFTSVIRNNGGKVESLLKVLREKTGRNTVAGR